MLPYTAWALAGGADTRKATSTAPAKRANDRRNCGATPIGADFICFPSIRFLVLSLSVPSPATVVGPERDRLWPGSGVALNALPRQSECAPDTSFSVMRVSLGMRGRGVGGIVYPVFSARQGFSPTKYVRSRNFDGVGGATKSALAPRTRSRRGFEGERGRGRRSSSGGGPGGGGRRSRWRGRSRSGR